MMTIPIWAFVLICLLALIGFALLASIAYTLIAITIQHIKDEKYRRQHEEENEK